MLVSIIMTLIWCQESAGMILEFVTFAHCHQLSYTILSGHIQSACRKNIGEAATSGLM